VTIDIGQSDNVHPMNKQDVGKRLALAGMKVAYQKDIVYSGPVYESMEIEGNEIRIKFGSVGSGLVAKEQYGYLKGFSISGSDKKFVWAQARIEGDEVVVSNAEILSPIAVRYGWAQNPHDANLYNNEGLPASPFRTDNWTGITYDNK